MKPQDRDYGCDDDDNEKKYWQSGGEDEDVKEVNHTFVVKVKPRKKHTSIYMQTQKYTQTHKYTHTNTRANIHTQNKSRDVISNSRSIYIVLLIAIVNSVKDVI